MFSEVRVRLASTAFLQAGLDYYHPPALRLLDYRPSVAHLQVQTGWKCRDSEDFKESNAIWRFLTAGFRYSGVEMGFGLQLDTSIVEKRRLRTGELYLDLSTTLAVRYQTLQVFIRCIIIFRDFPVGSCQTQQTIGQTVLHSLLSSYSTEWELIFYMLPGLDCGKCIFHSLVLTILIPPWVNIYCRPHL